MTWLRRATTDPHECSLPMREVTVDIPRMGLHGPPSSAPAPVTFTHVDGEPGDLWRCDECGKTWRVGDACDYCDAYGPDRHVRGVCTVGLGWRPASWWQAWRYR